MEYDLFGSYVVDPDEEVDDEITGEVADLLHLARETYPHQEIEIIVIARSA